MTKARPQFGRAFQFLERSKNNLTYKL